MGLRELFCLINLSLTQRKLNKYNNVNSVNLSLYQESSRFSKQKQVACIRTHREPSNSWLNLPSVAHRSCGNGESICQYVYIHYHFKELEDTHTHTRCRIKVTGNWFPEVTAGLATMRRRRSGTSNYRRKRLSWEEISFASS